MCAHTNACPSWSLSARTLPLSISRSGIGVTNREVITIVTTGQERQALQGRDMAERPWLVERLLNGRLTSVQKPYVF